MNWLPTFVSWPMAIAGMACAAGPLIIHLLNRRRFRTINWAAMEYLLQAMQRNRRILRLRDLVLLVLRTVAVLLIGLGLAQPYFTSDRTATFDGREPLHAVLLVDNSQSMGCQSLDGTLLGAAKRRGVELIRRLPAGSRITVAPLCGSEAGLTTAAFQSPEHAEEALERIELVGRSAPASAALNLAREAWQTEPNLAKRLVLLTDMQAVNWQGATPWDEDKPLQIVDVRPAPVNNTWIESVAVEDNLADIQTPAVIAVVVRHEGGQPRDNLQVSLKADGAAVGVQTINLPPGGSQEVTFQHLFNEVRPEPGRPRAIMLEASLPEDRLPDDDRRWHVAHVVASLPVVFVDQWGDQEDIAAGKIGETRHLRKLLAPGGSEESLIRVRHLRPDQLDRDQLADARLTVVAGVREPGPWTDLLLDYVRQGGQLVIAAGADFQPQAWTEGAWHEGRHLLPLPLEPSPVGAVPGPEVKQLDPFFLDFDSVRSHDYFRIVGVSEDELRDLYSEPMFFQAVAADERQAASPAASKPPAPEGDKDDSGNDANDNNDDVDAKRWVAWPPRGRPVADFGPARVLARYDRRRLPFLVEREVGEGRVTLVSTGLLAEWNTLPRTNAVLMMDRLLRAMLESTLAERNFPAQSRLTLPLPEGSSRLRWDLQRPGRQTNELLEPGFIGRQIRGVTIERPLTAGPYLLRGRTEDDESTLVTIPIGIQAPAVESQLTAADGADLAGRIGEAVQFVEHGGQISLAGQQTKGQEIWWWLVAAGLALLLLELLVLSPRRITPEAASATEGAA